MGGWLSTSSSIDPDKDLMDLTGKVAIVTGGSSGIGLTTAQMLVRKGAKVYIGARSQAKAKAAIEKVTSEGTNGGSIHSFELDLSHPRLAREGAERFLKIESRLDILVNNAAMLGGPYKMTKDGLLDIVITNHISPFVFTNSVLHLLKDSAKEPDSDTRVVNIASRAHLSAGTITSLKGKESLNIHYDDSVSGGFGQYGFTKLLNILHIKSLQKLNPTITCLSLHPGEITSPGLLSYLASLPFGSIISYIGTYILMDETSGSKTPAFAAAGKRVNEEKAKYAGKYLVPYGVLQETSVFGASERLAEELWETSESVAKELGVIGA